MRKSNGKENLFKNVEIVVAHYSEDIEWLKPYADYVTIYHKGKEDKPRFPVRKWVKIENVGREGETYLQHIINNYDNLADITLFLQGGIRDHIDQGHVYENILDYIKEARKYGFSAKRLFAYFRKDPQIVWKGKFLEAIKSGDLKKSKYSFASFYEEIFGKKQPYVILVFYSANFAITRKNIQKNGVNFYKKLHNHLNNHMNPEEGHFLERLWFTIFNPKIKLWHFKKIFIEIIHRRGKNLIKYFFK